MTKTPDNPQCVVRDALFLDPCWALSKVAHHFPGRAAGLYIRRMTNIYTRKPSRTYAVARTCGSDNVLNYCPFCGVRIDAPMRDDEAEAAA